MDRKHCRPAASESNGQLLDNADPESQPLQGRQYPDVILGRDLAQLFRVGAMEIIEFDKAIFALTGNEPFPWQRELLAFFRNGVVERSLDIPTGLGKTAVMALWLAARAQGAALPRRLVYVVDRRAVVDQATEVAEGLRKKVSENPELSAALGLETRSLPISTLRGQHVDNKRWLEDPTSPAIIVGTVDMIGSRLLFEGYGTSRKMRPYHAGLLGADTLVVLDEAHLVPAFEMLLETVAEGGAAFGPREATLREIVPPFKLLSLSATGRTRTSKAFGLTDADLKHPKVRQRLDALKRLTMIPLEDQKKLADALAEEAWKLTGNGATPARVIVFCDKREDAAAAKAAIEDLANGNKKKGVAPVAIHRQLFVGGRRVFDREGLAAWLKNHGFLAGTNEKPAEPTFIFATSAGEVGVDLDADHMVCDLVTWERMVQRLGRVNRRGEGDARVIVVVEPEPKPKKAVQDALAKTSSERTAKESAAIAKFEAALENARAIGKPLGFLPRKQEALDASPGAIREMKLKTENDPNLRAILDAATSPVPLRPALSRALVDAWSMSSLKVHTGRPKIDPWLRGWIENDPPQTSIVWRTHLPVRSPEPETRKAIDAWYKEIEAFFEAAPPHASECLETEMFRVVEWLEHRASALLKASKGERSTERSDQTNDHTPCLRRNDVAAIAFTPAADIRKVLKLGDFVFDSDDKKANEKERSALERNLAGATLVIDSRIAGLRDGLLDPKEESLPRTVDDGDSWLSATDNEPVVRFRLRVRNADTELPHQDKSRWRQRLRFATELSDEGEPRRLLIVEKWLHDAATEDDRSAGHLQLLEMHQQWAEARARDIAQRLGLAKDYTEMLAIAARLHDEGKKAKRWQRAFNAPAGGLYAKTPGPLNVALLDGYRHEFGSLPVAEKDAGFQALSPDLRDLGLHLIAAHHGFARPVIGIGGGEDAPPSALEERAREVALRFARLQKRWGPWGLTWWESLLRAADQQASRDNDAEDSAVTKEGI
jgi:CRISPR-associated endonuclease/helicase Cas3